MSRKRKKHARANRRPRPIPKPTAPAPSPAAPDAGWWRFKTLLCGVLLGAIGLTLFFWPASAGVAGVAKVAGRGYSAGSGGKSSSPPSGRGYSAGSGRPSPPSSGNRYSAGGSKPTPSPRPAPSPPVKVGKPSPPPTYRPTPPPLPKPIPPIPAGKSSATGSGRTYGKEASTNPSAGTKPTGSYDADAGRAQRHEESRADYRKGQQPKPPARPAPSPTYTKPAPPATYTRGEAPKPRYTDPAGKQRDIDPSDARVNELRKQLDAERWTNRRLREQQTYRNYTPPTVTYSDPFHSLFHYWLLQQAAEERARWVYHHRDEMDRRRYQELADKDRQLEDRLRELGAKRVPRDPTYAPPGIDPDLVYGDGYAEAVYNPKKVEPPPFEPTATADRETQSPPRSSWLLRLLTAAGVVALLGFVVWLVFVKRWGGDA